MNESKDIVVGIGEVLWDLLPEDRKVGGAPANFAYHVSQFRLPTCVVSAVGKDALGEEIVDKLSSKGINLIASEVPYPTGTVNVEVDCNGVPRYDIVEGVAWDNIPFTEQLETLARRTKAVCFGSLAQRNAASRDTIKRFLDAMPHQQDTLVVFDVNLRQQFYDKEILCDSMRRCNILKINDEELDIVAGLLGYPESDLKDQCRRLLKDFDLRILILTCGINGSYVFTTDKVSYRPTPRVKVADTVGAGDSFTASFIANIIRGKSVEEAHANAVRTSAYVCSMKGAMPDIPDELTD